MKHNSDPQQNVDLHANPENREIQRELTYFIILLCRDVHLRLPFSLLLWRAHVDQGSESDLFALK